MLGERRALFKLSRPPGDPVALCLNASVRLPDEVVVRLSAFVPERDLRRMRVVTAPPFSWFPQLFKMSATTFAPFVLIRPDRYRTDTSKGLALIAHETFHIGQVRELGSWRFYPRYLYGQLRTGFRHGKHPMEIPAIELQRAVRTALDAPSVEV